MCHVAVKQDMKRTNLFAFIFRWVAPLLVLAGAGLFVYAMGSRAKPNRKKAPPRLSIPVEVVHAVPHVGPLNIEANGVAIPYREVQLSAQVEGEVVFKADSLSPGQYVKKGEVLLKIDAQTYQMEVDRLKQEYAKAEQELASVQVKAKNTERLLELNREMVSLRKKDVERLNRLKSSSASSASETDAVRMAWLTTAEQMTAQENRLSEFDSEAKVLLMTRDLVSLQLSRAELDLKRTTILAPFSGVVIANHVEQNGAVIPGTAVATIEDTSMVEVRCSLRSDDLEFILQNGPAVRSATIPQGNMGDAYRLPATPVTIEYERGGRQYSWDGKLSRPDGLGMDARTRTMPVRIQVSNPTGAKSDSSLGDSSPSDAATTALLRGMFVKVKLHCEPKTSFLSVPESVVRPGKNVWVMRDGKLQVKPIRIARIDDGRAFFDPQRSGLNAADAVISSPVPNARNGMSVSLLGDKKGRGLRAEINSGLGRSSKTSGGQGSAFRSPAEDTSAENTSAEGSSADRKVSSP